MTELVYEDFKRKNPAAAETTYRHIWRSLRSNRIRVRGFRDPKNVANLPTTDDQPEVKVEIPADSIMRVSALPDTDALKLIGLGSKRDRQLEMLGNRQVLASLRDTSRYYQRYIDLVEPLIKHESLRAKVMLPIGVIGYIADKIVQNSAAVPELFQGRMVDFMAVPTMLIMARIIKAAINRRRLPLSVDYLANSPADTTARFVCNIDMQAATTLLSCYIVEAAQGLNLIPYGTFDWGDFAAYTIGGVGFWGLYKLREKRVTEYIAKNWPPTKNKR